jgi:hypothetical protein
MALPVAFSVMIITRKQVLVRGNEAWFAANLIVCELLVATLTTYSVIILTMIFF